MALTFDAGSDVGHASEILDLLEERGIEASFGLTGRWVRANPALARRIATDGHLIVNHSDTHASFTGRSTGTAGVDRDIGLAGYRFELMWTVDTLGWQGVPASEVTRRVLAAASPGEIVLMHVGAASTDLAALPDILDQLTRLGYAFVRADRF